MRNLTAIVLLLSACACQDDPPEDNRPVPILFADKPPLATVRMLEARLARVPCVGALDRWSRRYHYRAPGGRLDKQAIVIGLEEAGHDGRPAGVSIEPVYGVIELDHSQFRAAWGIYDARRQVIRFWTCGSRDHSKGAGIPPTLRPDLPM